MRAIRCVAILAAVLLGSCLDSLPDAEPVVNDSGANTDASTGGTSSGGSAGAKTDSGADASEAEAGDPCSSTISADYVIPRLADGTALTAAPYCSEAFWDQVPVFPLTLHEVPSSPSDNKATCKLVWSSQTTPSVLWGCCLVTDADVQGDVTPAKIDEDAWNDDSVEILIKADDAPALDDSAEKVIFSAAGGYRDAKWSGTFDPSFDAAVQLFHLLQSPTTLNDTIADKGYTLKFRMNLAFDVVAGQRSRCDLRLSDRDGTVPEPKHIVGFGIDHGQDMSTAGVCRFGCAPP